MALLDADVQAICEGIRRDGVFPEAYRDRDRDFKDITLTQLAAILAATADVSKGNEHYDNLRQIVQLLEQGAKFYADHDIPESYRYVKVGPKAMAFFPPPGDPGRVRVLAEVE